VLGTVALFATLAAWRGSRRSVVGTLAGAGSPARAGGVAAVVERLGLPQPFVLGARDSVARPGRAALLVLSLGLTVAAAVATLAMEASLHSEPVSRTTAPPAGLPALEWDVVDVSNDDAAELRPVVYGLDAALLALALSNVLAALLLAVRERARDMGVLKTIGLTPRQVSAAVVTAKALLAAAVGIPLGLVLFRAVFEVDGSAGDLAYPTWWWVVLLVPATVALVALVAAPTASHAASRPVSEALRHE
jgi:putative ABC transport system permease protein